MNEPAVDYLVMGLIFSIPVALGAALIALLVRRGNWFICALGLSILGGLIVGFYFNEMEKDARGQSTLGIPLIFASISSLYLLIAALLFRLIFRKRL